MSTCHFGIKPFPGLNEAVMDIRCVFRLNERTRGYFHSRRVDKNETPEAASRGMGREKKEKKRRNMTALNELCHTVKPSGELQDGDV